MQLKSHPHQLDLQFYWLIIQVKTAESGYDPARETPSAKVQSEALDVWHKRNKASNNPIMRM